MDVEHLLSQLEGLAHKVHVPGFPDLIQTVRNIYEKTIEYITPHEPISDGSRTLTALHAELDSLCTQLETSLPEFQTIYTGAGSDSYHSAATFALQGMQQQRDALAHAAQQHQIAADQFALARAMQILLITMLGAVVVTLGTLVFTGGLDAPISVPLALGETAGAAAIIATLTEALVAAGLAVDALLAFLATEEGLVLLAAATAAVAGLTHPHMLSVSQEEIDLYAEIYGIPKALAEKLLEAGASEAQIELAQRLHDLYPGLSLDDIIKLVMSGIAEHVLNQYLRQLCGGLPGIAQTIIDSENGNSQAKSLLNKILDQAKRAKDGTIGSQRVMAVLKKLGIDNIEDINMKIPGSDADVVTTNGTGIEVGGPGKGGQTFDSQLQKYIDEFGKGNVQTYLEDDGTQEAEDAIADATKKLGRDNVNTFAPEDRMCTE